MERGEIDAGLPRDAERFQAGMVQVLGEHADRRRADHVAGAGDRKSGNRQAARQGLEQHETERIGAAGENEHIGRGIDLSQFFPVAGAEEDGFGIFPLQRRSRRA
ncbi:hypothetical protein IXO812_20895, partial [Xanthomonas oryzae pv. oryzae]